RKSSPARVVPQSRPFGDAFWMVECEACRSWFRFDDQPAQNIGRCASCGRRLDPVRTVETREPLGFRTNFHPSSEVDSEGPSGRHPSTQAEAGKLELVAAGATNLSLYVGEQIRTYRLNRGARDPESDRWSGFSVVLGHERLVRGKREALLVDQM